MVLIFSFCMIFSCWQEAKQAVQLMYKWEMIDVCDALELLSPLFESEEVLQVPILLFFLSSNLLLDLLVCHPGIF